LIEPAQPLADRLESMRRFFKAIEHARCELPLGGAQVVGEFVCDELDHATGSGHAPVAIELLARRR
jgi:hypothetical protein